MKPSTETSDKFWKSQIACSWIELVTESKKSCFGSTLWYISSVSKDITECGMERKWDELKREINSKKFWTLKGWGRMTFYSSIEITCLALEASLRREVIKHISSENTEWNTSSLSLLHSNAVRIKKQKSATTRVYSCNFVLYLQILLWHWMMDTPDSCAVLYLINVVLILRFHDLSSGMDWSTGIETRGSHPFPSLGCQPKLWQSPKKRKIQLTNWKVYRHSNTRTKKPLTAHFENFLGSIRTNIKRCTSVISVSQGRNGEDAEFKQLRAMRPRAEQKHNRSGHVEPYLRAQRTHALMR